MLAPKKYSQSLVVRTAASEAAASRVSTQKAPQTIACQVVDFQVGDDGKVFSIPPGNPHVHAMSEATYGYPHEDTLKDAPGRKVAAMLSR